MSTASTTAHTQPVTIVEYTDPGCVWSWGSEPQLRWLRHRFGSGLRWRRVLGGQIRDLRLSHPDRDPVVDAEAFRQDWLAVAEHTGAPVPLQLEWMHRSTLPASAAVLAAELQGHGAGDAALRRLREVVFLAGRPANTPGRVAHALHGIPGLDLDRLARDAAGPAILAALDDGLCETRRPHPSVIGRTGPGPNPGAARPDGDELRYGFPTLLVDGPGGEHVLSGWNTAGDLEDALLDAGATTAIAAPLDPDAALDHYGTLTTADLVLLTDGREPTGALGGQRIDAVQGDPVWASRASATWLEPLVDEPVPVAGSVVSP